MAVVLLLAMFVFAACESDTKKGKPITTAPDSSASKSEVQPVTSEGEILNSVPSPVQMAFYLLNSDAPYNQKLLNSTRNTDKYSNSFSQAINLGVYEADLGYLIVHEQTQEALNYFESVNTLGDKLGILGAFEKGMIERVENNLDERDSLFAITAGAFKGNAYESQFYAADAKASEAVFRKDYWLPEMVAALEFCELNANATSEKDKREFAQHLNLLENEVYRFQQVRPDIGFLCADGVLEAGYSDEMAACYRKYFGAIKAQAVQEWKTAKDARNATDAVMAESFANDDAYTDFREGQHNEAVEKLVRNSDSGTRLLVRPDGLVRTYEPVYYTHPPRGLTGYRTHFYAPSKTLFGLRMDTFLFNLLVIWGMTLFLYGTLYFRVFRRILRFLQGLGTRAR